MNHNDIFLTLCRPGSAKGYLVTINAETINVEAYPILENNIL